MERSDSMEAVLAAAARGKRVLDSSSGHDEGQPDRKRPALASVIVEALKVDSLQRLCSSLEPILRRVVSEEVERALAKLGPAKLNGRSSPKQIEGPDGRNLQLHFRSRVSLPLFTGGKVEGEQGAAIHIVLIDANTGCAVTSGPESSVKLDLIVLEGDFNDEDDDNWTQEKFESHVVKEREGKRPLLTGDLQVTLKQGVGTLGELTFTDNSSWTRSRKFRLGLKVASGYCEGIRIREAKTNNLLALGPPQSSTPGSQGFCASDLNLHRGKEDFFSEDEIRTRSHDMLENEDMQQLLRIFNMGGQGLSSNSVTEDGYPYSSYIPSPSPSPSYSLSDNPSRSSGKAVVGWLKLKAALRWGIFVRKKAAERRAQLVELDDS